MDLKPFFSNWIVKNLLLALLFVIVLLTASSIVLGLFTRHGKEVPVPNLINMTVREASRVAASSGMRVVVSDSMYIQRMKPGTVYRQNPEFGAKVKKGRKIRLSINTMRPKMVPVPSLVGTPLRQAKAELQRSGLKLGKLIYVRDIATNNVIAQQRNGRNIPPGMEIPSGTSVDLVLGLNPADGMTAVPDLRGLQNQRAVDVLQESSFNVGRLVFDSTVKDYTDSVQAVVYSQNPGPKVLSMNPVNLSDTLINNFLSRGSEINLYLTTDQSKVNPNYAN